jgi:hypothetical protein
MRGFWSDPEGLSITEVLSLAFAGAYFIVAGFMVRLLAAGLLTRDAVDFFEVFTWPVLVILGGYFGNKLLDRLPSLRRTPPRLNGEDNEEEGRDDRATI